MMRKLPLSVVTQWKCRSSGITYTARVWHEQTTNAQSNNHGPTNAIAIIAMDNATLAIGILYLVML